MRSHLRLARRDELVDDDLRAVGEIAELRLPEHERIGLGERVAVLEAEHRLLREHRVDDLEARLVGDEMVERDVALLGLLVVEHRMALREGAALDVLAREADAVALLEKRAEGERLGGRPVDADAGLDRLPPRVEEALDGAVDVEVRRHLGEADADLLQLPDRDAGDAASRRVAGLGGLEAGPDAVEPVGLVGAVGRARLELDLELGAPARLDLLDLGLGDQPLADQLVGVDAEASSGARRSPCT